MCVDFECVIHHLCPNRNGYWRYDFGECDFHITNRRCVGVFAQINHVARDSYELCFGRVDGNLLVVTSESIGNELVKLVGLLIGDGYRHCLCVGDARNHVLRQRVSANSNVTCLNSSIFDIGDNEVAAFVVGVFKLG